MSCVPIALGKSIARVPITRTLHLMREWEQS